MELVGRQADLALLAELTGEIRSGGQALEIRGDPGLGKSALLTALDRRLTGEGWQVLRSQGVPTEGRLPLAALHQLLRPVLRRRDDLPDAEREVLETAFGLRNGEAEFFRIALATLDLLTSVAADAPVAVLVDDGHWLDRASADVLAFLGRRLSSDPVLLVVATRPVADDPFDAAGLPRLDLRPLDEDSSAALLDRTAPGLDPSRRRRVLGAAAGNPLALLELPRAPRVLPGAGQDLLPLTDRLEKAFAARIEPLPQRTRDVLLVAAVNDSERLSEALAAAGQLTGRAHGIEDLDPALTSGLAGVDGHLVGFRHPLVRTALVQMTTPGRRQAAHAALAGVLSDDPDRRTWHRALSTVGPDDDVATDLEDVADRAFRRGAAVGAVEALERSAQLTSSAGRSAQRFLRAAEVACQAGHCDVARRLLEEARPGIRSAPDRLRYEYVADLADESLAGGAERVLVLVELADRAAGTQDDDLAIRFLMRAATRCWHLDFGPEVEQQVLGGLARLPVDGSDPRSLVIRAYASPLDQGADIARAVRRRPIHVDDDPEDLLLLGYAAACVGASEEADTLCARAAERLRELGRLTPLAEALSLQAWAALRRSRFDVVTAVARECADTAADIGQPIPQAAALAALAAVAGIRGEDAEATALADRAERLAVSGRNTIGMAVTQVARGLIAAGAGRPDEAFDQLRQLCARDGRAHQRMQACWALGSFAEAAVQAGRADEARAELGRWTAVDRRGTPAGVDLSLRYAQALLAPPAEADDAFRAVLAADWSDRSFEHGRVLLAYGSRLRRDHRISEARPHLRAARDAFALTRARPWTDRAQRELRASGAGAPTTSHAALSTLSPQELQIARLVVEGLGNKEIGQRLFLSHRTVGSHLYRMFPKLGVSSRAQLVRVLSPALDRDEAAGTSR